MPEEIDISCARCGSNLRKPDGTGWRLACLECGEGNYIEIIMHLARLFKGAE